MNLGKTQIIQGNALNLPLPNNSVDLVCTSPPYFGLRSYQDGGMHYEGQIGSEVTPAEFLDALLAATREMVRVLKPSGSIFVNLGDKYGRGTRTTVSGSNSKQGYADPGRVVPTGQDKSLLGIPWRYAIRCIDDLGLILRAEIIWNKPNGLPESVTDRVRRSHEQWFHLVKQPRYFSAIDEIREEHYRGPNTHAQGPGGSWNASRVPGGKRMESGQGATHRTFDKEDTYLNPLGKLPSSVWTIPTQPLTVPPELGVDHFAAYPMEWPRRIIQGWTPNGVCTVCGQGRRPVSDKKQILEHEQTRTRPWMIDLSEPNGNAHGINSSGPKTHTSTTITGYICGCPDATAPTTPAVVLDPFMGTGTTLVVAKALGRNSVGVDLSADYCRLARWRTNDSGELAAALQVEKPDVIPAGQASLF